MATQGLEVEMAAERLPMRKIKDILRQKWLLGRPHRQIVQALGVGLGSVTGVLERAAQAQLSWEVVESLSEAELEVRLYRASTKPMHAPLPDPAALDLELKKPGVTLQLLHVEYRERCPDGYGYTQFCGRYRDWKQKQRVVMRQVHRAGEKMFTDYAGKKPHWIDPMTGELKPAELFVAVLGASNYTYAEATETQKVADWIGSNTRAVEYFGGVPTLTIPDQLKSAVTKASAYEPEIQRNFEQWATHYGTLVLPARPRRPRDQAKVEVGVQVVERWILARLRHQRFFSLAELNTRIRELLEDVNARVMRRYGKSRRELFETLERAALKPLPAQRFECAAWSRARVHVDYHVVVDHHYYSAPFPLVHHDLDVRLTHSCVEVFLKGERVALHARSFERGRFTTNPAHMPKAHQKHSEWSPTRLILWAKKVGPLTAALVEAILADRPHPEQGYRSCLGLMRLARGYGAERMEAASARALSARARSYKHVESILKNGLDRLPVVERKPANPTAAEHENLRGHTYYE
jgi:transposase